MIVAKQDADRRTKNRISEHPNLVVEKWAIGQIIFPGEEMVLCRSSDGWLGWFAKDSIDIVQDRE